MARKRRSLRPVDRFEIFKRDGFRCQYCGAAAGESVLEVDHIRPVSDGGTNDAINLVTSCETCNRGKAARKLTAVPESVASRIERDRELEKQMIEADKLRRSIARRHAAHVREVSADLARRYGLSLGPKDSASVSMFVKRLGVADVLDAVIASSKAVSNGGRFRYFCGVCWKKIGEKERLAAGDAVAARWVAEEVP